MERQIHLHLSFAYEPRVLRPWLAAALLLLAAGDLASENVTLTTYYPAPSGVYTQLIATQNAYLARDGGRVAIGMGSTAPSYELDVQGPSGNWATRIVSGSASAYLAHSTGYGAYIDAGPSGSGTYALNVNKGGTPYLYVRGDGPVYTSNNISIAGPTPGTNPYLYVNASGCTQTSTDNGSCSGYVTWTPGVYTANYYWYTGPRITITGSTSNGTIAPGTGIGISQQTPPYYCCSK